MSRAGTLRPDELSTITGGEQLAIAVAPNFAGADRDLRAAFGFGMRILTPFGGYRTRDDQTKINPGLSADSSDHCRGHAIDIDNQRQFRNANEARFEQILAAWGWKFTARSANPKKDEPWHAVNDGAHRAGAPALLESESELMIYESTSASADGVVAKGISFANVGGSPLRMLSALEHGAYAFWNERGRPTPVAEWSGDDIRKLSRSVGMYEVSSVDDNLPIFTGRIFFDDPQQADFPHTIAVRPPK